MSSIYGILASMLGQTKSAQEAKRNNAAKHSPLASHNQASTGRSTNPVSRHEHLGRTLAHAHHINPKGNSLTATSPGSDLTNISRALKQSTRIS